VTIRSSLVILAALAAWSCSQDAEVVSPSKTAEWFLSETNPIRPSMRTAMEGVYRVVEGQGMFGDLVALKWSYVANGPDTTYLLSGFFGRDVAFFELEGGTLDSVFFFAGTWRKMVNTETGLVRLTITRSQGGAQLFQPLPVIGKDSITFVGGWGSGNDNPSTTMVLRYDRPLYQATRLEIVAHRGGGRTSDLLPVSENSVEMVRYTGRLGSTGIEIDIHITRDGVPILYHDSNLNLRLTQKSGLVGPVEEYTYAQLQGLVRLINGERIPTLQEVLDAALYQTGLRFVWLDMKAVQASMPLIREIQKEYVAKAAAAGREFEVLIGLPTQDKVDEFLTLPDYQQAGALCELDVEKVRQTNARVWGPRWTEGTQVELVAQMQGEGRRVFVWTLDVPAYVQEYIANGRFDGILSNYPTIVAYYHYVR